MDLIGEWEVFIMESWRQQAGMEKNKIQSMSVDSVSGVEVSPKCVTSQGLWLGAPGGCEEGLKSQDVLGGDALLLPKIHGLPSEPEVAGDLFGGYDPFSFLGKGPRKGGKTARLFHLSVVPHHLPKGKQHLLVPPTGPQDDMRMADIPRPDSFSSLQAWLAAVLRVPGITQEKIASFCGVKRQAVALWLKGGNIKPPTLQKLAQYAATDYLTLRSLADGQPLPGNRKARLEARLRRDPEIEGIAAMLDAIAGDKPGLKMVRSLVQQIVAERLELMKGARTRHE